MLGKDIFVADTLDADGFSEEVHPDFGNHVASIEVSPGLLPSFSLAQPLIVKAYRNEDGFTVLLPEFSDIAGYGDSQDEAYAAWLEHFLHLRAFYGRLQNDQATEAACSLRDRLSDLLLGGLT